MVSVHLNFLNAVILPSCCILHLANKNLKDRIVGGQDNTQEHNSQLPKLKSTHQINGWVRKGQIFWTSPSPNSKVRAQLRSPNGAWGNPFQDTGLLSLKSHGSNVPTQLYKEVSGSNPPKYIFQTGRMYSNFVSKAL